MAEDFDISQLNPEDVRDKPNWFYSPWVLAVTHLVLLVVGIMEIQVGLITETLGWKSLAWYMWVWGLWGLAVGVGWFVVAGVRSAGRYEILLYCVLKDQAPLACRFRDWRGDTIKALFFAAGIATTFLLSGVHRNLSLGAFVTALVVGTLPNYVYVARRWRLAWQIIRQVKAKEVQ